MGRAVMAGRRATGTLLLPTLRGAQPKGRKAKAATGAGGLKAGRSAPGSSDAPADEAVLEALRDWRRDQARQRAVPAYVVMHDKTLEAIAAAMPQSADELGDIPGIGPAKLAAYGDALLQVIKPRS